MRGWRQPTAVLAALAVAGLAIWGFMEGRGERATEAEREQPVKAPLRVSRAGGAVVVTLDAATQRASGIEVLTVHSASRIGQETAYGAVLDLQPLTDLSNSFATARAQLRTTQAKLRASRAAFERAEGLYRNQQVMSAAEFQALEATFRVDEAAVAAAESQVHTISSTALQDWGPVLADAIEQSAPPVPGLIRHSEVLMQVTLPAKVRISEPPAHAYLQGDGGATTRVRFVSAATKTDPSLQGLSFYYIAPAGAALLSGTKVIVFLPSDSAVKGTAVPASAIVWWQGRAWVYLRTGPQSFARREIPTDVLGAEGSHIVGGLPDPVELVTQGAQLLLSEELRAGIQLGEEGV